MTDWVLFWGDGHVSSTYLHVLAKLKSDIEVPLAQTVGILCHLHDGDVGFTIWHEQSLLLLFEVGLQCLGVVLVEIVGPTSWPQGGLWWWWWCRHDWAFCKL